MRELHYKLFVEDFCGIGQVPFFEGFARLAERMPDVRPDRYGPSEPLAYKFDAATFAGTVIQNNLLSVLIRRKKPFLVGMMSSCPPPRRSDFRNALVIAANVGDYSSERFRSLAAHAAETLHPDLIALHIVEICEQEIRYCEERAIAHTVPSGRGYTYDINGLDLGYGLQDLPWLTVFGELYVEHFGRERLLSAPAPVVQEVAPGQVLIQLTKNFTEMADDWERFNATRQAVIDHLGRDSFMSVRTASNPRPHRRHPVMAPAVRVPPALLPIREYQFQNADKLHKRDLQQEAAEAAMPPELRSLDEMLLNVRRLLVTRVMGDRVVIDKARKEMIGFANTEQAEEWIDQLIAAGVEVDDR